MKKMITLCLALCMLLGVYAPSASAAETTLTPNTGVEITASAECDLSKSVIPCHSDAAPVKGDLNGDGMITAADINILIYAFKNGKFPCDANGHSYNEFVITAPTCEVAGECAYVCTLCGDSYTDQIAALGHSYEETFTAPTAKEDGYTAYTCACGDSYMGETVTPMKFTVTSSNRADIGYTGVAGENLVIPAVFEKDGVWYRVTSIGYEAFYNCSNLASVVIPDSVTSIGSSAFSGCSNLNAVYISDLAAWCGISFNGSASNPLYYAKNLYLNGELVTDLVIPDSVTSIGSYAFYYCSNLTSVTIGSGVTSIGNYAFDDCFKLVEVINKSSLSITAGSSNNGYVAYYAIEVHTGESKIVNQNDYLFYTYNGVNYLIGYVGSETALTLPASYNGQSYEIYDWAFSYRSDLTSVVIPDSVTSIGSAAFACCSNLTSVTIGSGVTSIGDSAFHTCKSLTSFTIPAGVLSVGTLAFRNCTSLTSLTIEGASTTFGGRVFEECTQLVNIKIPDNAVGLSSGDLYNTGYLNDESNWENGVLYLGKKLLQAKTTLSGSYTVKDGTLAIDVSAFSGCKSLTSIVIPDSVTSIGNGAFQNCSSLKSITIPDSVTSIGRLAFSNCTNLTSIVIPDSVTSIGNSAFSGCTKLTSVTIGAGVITIGRYAFQNCTNLTNMVFKDLDTWYRTTSSTNWENMTGGSYVALSSGSRDVLYFTSSQYCHYYWYKK